MAWPNPFRKRTENTRTCWGYTFQLTEEHWSEDRLRPLKFAYDKLGEECLNVLNELDPPTSLENVPTKEQAEKPQRSKPKRDLYRLLESNVEKHPKLQELWTQVNTIPEWVDWVQVRWSSTATSCSIDSLRYQEVWYTGQPALAKGTPTIGSRITLFALADKTILRSRDLLPIWRSHLNRTCISVPSWWFRIEQSC